MSSDRDQSYMARALSLAGKGLYSADPNPRVGCVLVKDNAIIGEGWHQRTGEPHAEANALRQAGSRARGATAYITLEPCCYTGRTPPCTDALLAAGVSAVIAAMEDPNPRVAGQGFAQLRAAGVAVKTGLLATQARALNPGFILRFSQGRPLIRCKLAMSLDGRTALASGESQWITSPAARQDGQSLRARSSAIMTGVSTVLADDPALNVRLPDADVRQPLRVILDTELRTPTNAKTLTLPGQTLILTGSTDTALAAALRATGAEVQTVATTSQGLDLSAVAALLAERGMNEVHLECGPTLAGAFLTAGLLDEMVIYMAPLLLGDNARSLFHLPSITTLAEGIALAITDVRAVGSDWRITAHPNRH